MENNKVDREAEAFWRQHKQELERNPQLADSRDFWKGKATLLDSLVKVFEKDDNLNRHERASLAVMKAERKTFEQRGSRQLARNFTVGLGQGVATTLKLTSKLYNAAIDQTLDRISARAPFLLMVPIQLLRIPGLVGSLLIDQVGNLTQFLTNSLASANSKAKVQVQQSVQTGKETNAMQDKLGKMWKNFTGKDKDQSKDKGPDQQIGFTLPSLDSHRANVSGASTDKQQADPKMGTGKSNSPVIDTPFPTFRLPGLSSIVPDRPRHPEEPDNPSKGQQQSQAHYNPREIPRPTHQRVVADPNSHGLKK